MRIAIENCPMIFSYDEWPGGDNLAFAPAIWREMFTAIPDENFGLNFDPSHLDLADDRRRARGPRVRRPDLPRARQGPRGAARRPVRARRDERRASAGRSRALCGLGQVDWGRFIGALYAVGYDNVVSVEHEDRGFEGSVELVQRGFLIARNTLRPLLA